MTINPPAGNSHEHAPRAWLSRHTPEAWTNLPPLWRLETVRHMAFTAFVALLGAFLLSQFMPHVPGWATTTDGLLATIDTPVRHYLTTRTQALPTTGPATYSIWRAIGAASLMLGFFHNGPARFTWTLWGGATVAMVWIATPDSGRQVAAGVALLAWAALSCLALRGLRLPPPAVIHVDVHNEAPPAPDVEVRAEIHIPRAEPPQYMPYALPFLPPSPN